MTQTLDLIIAAKNQTDAAFKQLVDSLGSAEKANEKLPPKVQSTTDKFAGLADTVGRTSTTIARSADTLGLPIGPLRALDDVADIAELSFKNLSGAQIGFNTSTLGVVGAGAAVGVSIGLMIRNINGAAEAYDALALAALNSMGVLAKSTGPDGYDPAKIAAIEEQAAKKRIDVLRSTGMTIEQIEDHLHNKRKTTSESYIERLKKEEAAQKKAAEAAQRAAEVYARAAEQARVEWDRFYEAMDKRSRDVTRAFEDDQKRAAQAVADKNKARLDDELATQEKIDAAEEERARKEDERTDRETEQWKQAQEEKRAAFIQAFGDMSETIASFGDLLSALGVSGSSSILKIVDAASIGVNTVGRVLANLHNPVAAVGAALGGVAQLIGRVFGNSENKKVNDMRDSFVALHGGITALDQKAHAAGLTLDRLLAAKKVKDFEAAVKQLTGAFDLQAEAQQKVNGYLEEFGFTLGEMGNVLSQQKLDEQFAHYYEAWQLLNAAGVDHTAIINRMGPTISKYVDAAVSAGDTIPAAMQPIIEELFKSGKLIHENGEQFTQAEYDGIHFAQALTEKVVELIDKVISLMNAIRGIPDRTVNVNVNTNYTTSGAPPPGGGQGSEEETGGGGGGGRRGGGGRGQNFNWFPHPAGGVNAAVGAAISNAMAATSKSSGGMGAGGGGMLQPVQLVVDSRVFGEVILAMNASGRLPIKMGSLVR